MHELVRGSNAYKRANCNHGLGSSTNILQGINYGPSSVTRHSNWRRCSLQRPLMLQTPLWDLSPLQQFTCLVISYLLLAVSSRSCSFSVAALAGPARWLVLLHQPLPNWNQRVIHVRHFVRMKHARHLCNKRCAQAKLPR